MAIYKDLNDYEIMYLVEENDEYASEVLFDKYRPIILKIASQYKNEAKKYGLEMDDLVQEGYLGLYNAIQTYDSNNDVLFYTYALVSIRSKILNILTIRGAGKNRLLNQAVSLSSEVSGIDDVSLIDILEDKSVLLPHFILEENEFSNVIHDFLLSIDFDKALIFELKLNGFKNIDIAELLNVQIKYVSNTLFRIRKQFKQYLNSMKFYF